MHQQSSESDHVEDLKHGGKSKLEEPLNDPIKDNDCLEIKLEECMSQQQ